MIASWFSHSAKTSVPHIEQKRRSFPGVDSNAFSLSSPAVNRNALRATRAVLVYALEFAFRQVLQWQRPIGDASWSASYLTAAHKQLPTNAI
jgi:hypothetical protein